MVKRTGKFGEFWGCPKFPECKGTRRTDDWYESAPGEKLQDDMQLINTKDWKGDILYGVAVSVYGGTGVGKAVSRAKYYEDGDFSDELFELTVNMFKKRYGERKFDLIVYVPSTKSGDKVRHFVEKMGSRLGIEVSHDLYKTREIELQKSLESKDEKVKNVKGAFAYRNINDIKDKKILVFDDIVGSGATLKEICEYLCENGAECVSPFAIAKTYRGI